MNNRKLKDLIELSSSVQLYIPENNTSIEERVSIRFSNWFGGATVYDALGCWQSPAEGLIKEQVRIVKAYCTESALKKHIEDVIEEAVSIKREMKQESVALEVNNKMYLV